MSSSMLCSHGLVLATAITVSAGTLILFDLLREKYSSISETTNTQDSTSTPTNQILRSCLSSGSKKKDGKGKKKKKRVNFADDVKDSSDVQNGEEYRKKMKKKVSRIHMQKQKQCVRCGSENVEIGGIKTNRAALYNGIMLRNRLQTISYSF